MTYRYEFQVPARNGLGLRTHQSDKSPEEIKQVHPKARITARLTLDDNGRLVAREEWNRKLAAEAKGEEVAAAPVPDETPATTTTTTTTPAPAKGKSK